MPNSLANPGAPCAILMIVPTYNEHGNLAQLVTRVFANATALDLLIVDDESPDGTAELCRQLQRQFPRLRLLERKGPRGLGRAYLAGMKIGLQEGYDVIGTMDADLSHDPTYLPQMLERSAEADVVIGSRYIKDGGTVNWRLRRILLSWLANLFASKLLGVNAHDMTSGFRLYRTNAVRGIDLESITSTGYSFLVETLYLLAQSGATIAEVPIIFTDRSMGKSKLGSREIYLGAFHLIRMRFRRWHRSRQS
jgi:dolichol-phosphate mannosyltransferase